MHHDQIILLGNRGTCVWTTCPGSLHEDGMDRIQTHKSSTIPYMYIIVECTYIMLQSSVSIHWNQLCRTTFCLNWKILTLADFSLRRGFLRSIHTWTGNYDNLNIYRTYVGVLWFIDPTPSIGLPLRTPDCSMVFFLVFSINLLVWFVQ